MRRSLFPLALAGAIALAAPAHAQQHRCSIMLDVNARMSRAELSRLIAIPAGTDRATVEQAIGGAYCRFGAWTAYPLEFDPDVWIIVLYDGNVYLTFDYSFERDRQSASASLEQEY